VASPDLGPLKLGEILDRMFVIYRRNFLLLFAISGIPHLCLLLIVLIAIFSGTFSALNSQQSPSPDAFGRVITAFFAFAFLLLLAGLASWLAATAAIWQIQMGGKPTIRRAYRVARHRMGAALLAAIVAGAALFVGYIFLVIPAVFVALELSLTMEAIVCEGEGPFAAMSRSRKLVSGYRGKVFVAWLVCTGVSTAMSYLVIIPPLIAMPFIMQTGAIPSWFIAILVVAYFLALTVPAPLLAIALYLIYYDARVRKEGFDLQRLLDELPPGSAGATPEIAVS
jgi:hypothetical protein